MKTTLKTCQHEVIQTWRTDDGKPVMWACKECRLRFYPVGEYQPDNVSRKAEAKVTEE